MKEKLKQLRINVTISALISIVIGALLIIYPDQVITAMGRVVAVIIILAGVFFIISQIFEFGLNALGIVVGAVLAIIGVWIFASPTAVLTIIPIAIGVILVVHGVQDLSMAIEGSRAHMPHPWIAYIIAALNIILGLLCVSNAFGLVDIALRLIGIMLVYDGITDIGIVHGVRKATGGIVDSVIIDEEDIL